MDQQTDTGTTGGTTNATGALKKIEELDVEHRQLIASMVETAFAQGKKLRTADVEISPANFAKREWAWLYKGFHDTPGNYAVAGGAPNPQPRL